MTQHVDSIEPPPMGELDSHIGDEIEACRAALGADVREEDVLGGASAEMLLQLEERVGNEVAAEQGLVAKLRSLPTSQRIALIACLAATVTVITVVARPRSDLSAYPMDHMAISLVLLLAVLVAAAWRLLRPLHAPPPSVWASRGLLAAGVLLPAALAVFPLEHTGVAPGEGAAFAVACSKCLGFGGAMGFPVLLLAFFMRRARVDGAAITAIAGVVAGITGNLALQVHCPITDPAHLLAGHATLVVLLGVAAAAWKR